MMDLGKSLWGVTKALAGILRRDPLALFGRLDYWAEVESWEMRIVAISGQPYDEARRLVGLLPTDTPGRPDLRILAQTYNLLYQGVPWEELVDTGSHDQVGTVANGRV